MEKQAINRRRDPSAFRNRFSLYKQGIPVYDRGRIIPYEDRDYDYARANELGYTPDETGHMPTRDYKTGAYLKSVTHPTLMKSIVSDLGEGYIPVYNEQDGHIYSHRFPDDLPVREESKIPEYKNGKLPGFANGIGGVLNSISEEYTPLVSNTYQQMVNDAKQQVAKFAVDDYAYRVQKQHPEVTKELLLGIYNSTPYIGSDSRKGSTVGQYWHGEDDGYGRRVMIYPRSMKSDDPEFNLQDRILSTVLHESNHLLRDVIFGGKYTDKEREYLLNAYPGVPINEAAALNAQIREKLSKVYGNGAVGEKLDATLEKLHKNKGMQNEMMFHLNNLNGYGHADKVNGSWDPKLIDAMMNALMNVASVQRKPKNGLLQAKDGKLPGYEDGTTVAPLTKSPQEILKGVPHEQGLSGADPIGKAFVAYMGGRAITGAMAAWNRLRALKQGKLMYKQAREWNDQTRGASRAWKMQDADKFARDAAYAGSENPVGWLYDMFGRPLVNFYDKMNQHPIIGPLIP